MNVCAHAACTARGMPFFVKKEKNQSNLTAQSGGCFFIVIYYSKL